MNSGTRLLGRVMVVTLIALCFVAAVPSVAAATFTDPGGRFSFTIPDGYTPLPDLVKPPVVAAFASPNPAGANFTVQIRDTTSALDAAIASLRQEYITAAGGTAGADPRSLALGGLPAQQYDFFNTTNNTRFHIAQVVTVKESSLYILTFTAQEPDYDALISQTAAVLLSFSFTGIPAAAAATTKPASSISGNTYIGQGGLYSFTIPTGFTQGTLPADSHLDVEFEAVSGSGVRAILTAEAFTVTGTPTLDIASQADRDSAGADYTFLSEQAAMLGNLPARRVDFARTRNDVKLRYVDLLAVKDKTIFFIGFITPNSLLGQYEPTLSGLATSFNVGGVPGQPPANTPPPSNTPPPANNPPPSQSPAAPPTALPSGGGAHD